jgi:hypothetical protein
MPARTGGAASALAIGATRAAMAMVNVRNRIGSCLRIMKIEFAEGQEGSAVSKTRRFQKKTSKQRAMHDVI